MTIEAYHFDFMAEAIREAELSIAEGGLPIGAVLTRENKIIARGHNRRESVTFPGSKDILSQFGIPFIDLSDQRSIDMMQSWRSVPANERLWQGDIGN